MDTSLQILCIEIHHCRRCNKFFIPVLSSGISPTFVVPFFSAPRSSSDELVLSAASHQLAPSDTSLFPPSSLWPAPYSYTETTLSLVGACVGLPSLFEMSIISPQGFAES